MSPGLINILLWTPFLFVAFIAALVYVISGARRGFGHALVSLGATIVSAVLSIVLAKLISSFISSPVTSLIPFEDMLDGEMPAALVTTLSSVLVQMLLAYILLFLLFIIFTAVLRHVGRKIYDKANNKKLVKKAFPEESQEQPDAPKPTRVKIKRYPAGLRLAGAAVGIISAFIFSIVLLLPTYGTLAAYVPAAEVFVRMPEVSESEPAPTVGGIEAPYSTQPYYESNGSTPLEILECITVHPIVTVSGSVPFDVAYSTLSTVKVNGHSFNLPKIADVTTGLAVNINRFSTITPDDADFVPVCKEIITTLRNEVFNSNWSYGIFSEVMTVLKNDPESADDLAYLMPIADISRDEFTETGNVLLDFLSLALEKDIVSILSEEDEERLFSSGILKDLGKTLNSTDTIVSLKANYISIIFTEYFSWFMSEADINSFLKSYPITKLTEPEQYEIEAAIILFGTDDIFTLLEQ